MSRIRIEGLLAAFPKLVGTGKQHTYVETENVRYLYQPIETMYLVLVTNKSSNILEDLETLRLCGKVVPEYVDSLEEDVAAAAFDLLFAFDEVISLGHKENVTVAQVRQNTEMESHEEKLHKMIIQSKIAETKEAMKKRAQEIEKTKIEAMKGMGRMTAISSMQGGGGMGSGMGGGMGSSMGGGRMDTDAAPSYRPEPAASAYSKAAEPARGPKKGMQLGKSKAGGRDFLESLKAEGEAVEDVSSAAGVSMSGPPPPSEAVFIAVDEKISCVLNKDGGVENCEVQGTMSLQIKSEADACLRVALTAGANTGYQFKTHPNIDKAAYGNESVLCLKDPSRPFPTGAPLGVLKWRLQTREEAVVPLTINCWPSISGGESYVNIEYESTAAFDLQHVHIFIPLPAGATTPQVNQIDGDWRYDMRRSCLVWSIEMIDDTNRTGSAEFVVPAAAPASFFPIEVEFSATKTICEVQVATVTDARTGAPVKYGARTALTTEGYHVE
ncbi:coatomer subunit delta-like [Micractinium conductrix]|uniref:Coatomer subunit delta n=1 Tax=Micractinium conductrix TaxID=554055 RepID=A0A2P6V527_9CHLO|nr:coatomer subunit delta-like [Micractinium conductrix]|eukprot:PSC69188.1 coatomer subunit delta-like [Micractinium conductrix]